MGDNLVGGHETGSNNLWIGRKTRTMKMSDVLCPSIGTIVEVNSHDSSVRFRPPVASIFVCFVYCYYDGDGFMMVVVVLVLVVVKLMFGGGGGGNFFNRCCRSCRFVVPVVPSKSRWIDDTFFERNCN